MLCIRMNKYVHSQSRGLVLNVKQLTDIEKMDDSAIGVFSSRVIFFLLSELE